MRSVNVAELKKRLSEYISFAKGGEEVVNPRPQSPGGETDSDIIRVLNDIVDFPNCPSRSLGCGLTLRSIFPDEVLPLTSLGATRNPRVFGGRAKWGRCSRTKAFVCRRGEIDAFGVRLMMLHLSASQGSRSSGLS